MQLDLEKKRLEKEQKAREEERKRILEEKRKKELAEAEELRAFNARQATRRWEKAVEDIRFKCTILRWVSRFFFLLSFIAYVYPAYFPVRSLNRFIFFCAIIIRLNSTRKAEEKKILKLPL